MNSRNIASRGAAALALLGCLLGGTTAQAQTMDQYYAVPPFVSDQVSPNILLILDNSGSMGGRACDPTWCGVHSDTSLVPVNQSFVADSSYSGFFDPRTCYTYDATAGNTRFQVSTVRASLTATCGASEWDGNLLNWATFRRFDALKKAMSGGDCVVTRNPDGTCPPTGSPAQITIKAQSVFGTTACCQHHTTNALPSVAVPPTLVPGSGASSYVGRIPQTVAQGGTGSNPANLFIHLRGGNSGMEGSFCVDNDNDAPASNANACNVTSGGGTDNDAFAESQFRIRLAVAIEPTGVVQQIGAQARFGLFEFKGTGEGARMLVGLGLRQSIDWSGSSLETFNTNTAAMLDAIGESFPATNTPLSESLYDAARYVAQINSTFDPNNYVYPIAFSGSGSNGVSLAATGTGSLGSGELKVLTGSENCPSGYITNACGRDPYFFGSDHSPPWASTSTVVPCCKTFIILVTDGEPTQDNNIPSALRDYAHGQHGIHCNNANATIHAPNGVCNTNPATPAATLLGEHKTDYGSNGTHYLDDVAYWAHINDLRPCNGTADGSIAGLGTTGHCLPGLQNINFYTFFAFGNIAGREILMHAARLGGFEDTNSNNIPDVISEWDKVINATGAPGTDGYPDNFFESSNVDDLQERLMATITSILRKSASGTSVSVLSSSSTGEGSIYQAYFYTSVVGQGGANVRWAGFAHGLFVDSYGNFREDTVKDAVLDYKTDLIVTTRFDNDPSSPTYKKVLVDRYLDANGDGVADSTTPVSSGAPLDSLKPIWEAGAELANATSASRQIITWVDTNNNGVVDASEQIDFSTTNCAALRDYLRYVGDACSGSSNAMNLINFIRGDEIAGLRTRMVEVPVGSGSFKVWKLGDAIHSTPTVVAAPTARFDLLYGAPGYNAFYQQYRNRRQVMYLGANDGMLHAFNGGFYHKGDDPTTTSVIEHGWFTKDPTNNATGPNLGAELWGFIPMQLLPHLQWLAKTDYTHVYYVDLKPTIADVRIFTPDADHPGGWGTILIGGFRMGGSCGRCAVGTGAPPMTATIGGVSRTFYSAFFVLDVTNPEVGPKLLWSFSDINLGLTTSTPTVVRMNPDTDAITSQVNEKWYVVFGSGPNGYQAELPAAPSQTSALYAVDLVAGPGVSNANVTRLPAGSVSAFMGPLISADKDLDFRTDVVYAGRTLNYGSPPLAGKMYRLSMKCPATPCTPSSWGIASGGNRIPTEMINSFSDPSLGTVTIGPVTASPTWTLDDSNQVWVFFGTGRYIGNSDKVNNTLQHLFGMKDSVVNGTCAEVSVSSCYTNNLVNATNAVVCIVCSGSTNQVSDPTNPSVTTFNGTGTTSMVGLVASKDGWRVTMSGPFSLSTTTSSGTVTTNYSSERSVVNPTLFVGTVFFPTFSPTADFCGSDGISFLYALFYKTGTASTSPVIGTSTSGGNTNVTTKMQLGIGMASALSIHLGNEGATLYSQMSNSNTRGAAANPGGSGDVVGEWSRFGSWIHQRD